MSNLIEVKSKTGKKPISTEDFDLHINGCRIAQKTVSKALVFNHLNTILNRAIKEFEEGQRRAEEMKAEQGEVKQEEVKEKKYYSRPTDYVLQWSIRINEKLEFELLDGENGEDSFFVIDHDLAPTEEEQWAVFNTTKELLAGCNDLRTKVAKFTARRTPGPYAVGVNSKTQEEEIYEYVGDDMVPVTTAFLESKKVIETMLNLNRADKALALRNNKNITSLKLTGKHLNGVTLKLENNIFKVEGLNTKSELVQGVVNQFLDYFEVTEMGIIGHQMLIKISQE